MNKNNYLNRKLDNWDWIKSASKEDLIKEIKHHYPEFSTEYEPFLHQYACIYLGIVNHEFNFFLDMGLGKTFVTLNLIKYWGAKALVLVPNEINVIGWKDEIEKFTDLKAVCLSGLSKKKLELLDEQGDIFISNYMGFLRLFTVKINNKSQVNYVNIKKLLKDFDIVVYDEIHKLGNSKSLITDLCDSIQAKIRYGLTGTAFGKSPERLWSEFKVIDDGETLGKDERIFKSAYFTKSFNYFGKLEYRFKDKLKAIIKGMIKHRSITYHTSECVDLPEINKQIIKIKFEKEGNKYYTQSYEGLLKELKDGETAIQNSFVRLRCICAGYLYVRNEDNRKVKSEFIKNPKLDYLIEMVNGIDEKIIIFNEYTLTGDMIEKRLKKEKITYKRLYGATKDKQQAKKDFQNDKSIKVFLLNSKSGGTGSNLQFCRYAIFYETPVEPDVRLQCDKRIHRIGQDKTTFIYDLIMINSLEEKILTSLKEGKNLYEAIMKGEKL